METQENMYCDDTIRKGVLSGIIAVPEKPDQDDMNFAAEMRFVQMKEIKRLFPDMTLEARLERQVNGVSWAKELFDKCEGEEYQLMWMELFYRMIGSVNHVGKAHKTDWKEVVESMFNRREEISLQSRKD